MYIHEQMASPAFHSVCHAVSEEWAKLPLAATAESTATSPECQFCSGYRQDNSREKKQKHVPRITPHSFQIG